MVHNGNGTDFFIRDLSKTHTKFFVNEYQDQKGHQTFFNHSSATGSKT